jgi:hypothetical protein
VSHYYSGTRVPDVESNQYVIARARHEVPVGYTCSISCMCLAKMLVLNSLAVDRIN